MMMEISIVDTSPNNSGWGEGCESMQRGTWELFCGDGNVPYLELVDGCMGGYIY